MKTLLGILTCLSCYCCLFAQDQTDLQLSQLSNSIQSSGKTALDTGSTFLGGLAQSFGYCPDDYLYSFQVWNDLPVPLYVASQRIRSVQGAEFSGTLDKDATLCPFTMSGDLFFNRNQCHAAIWLCTSANNNISYAVLETALGSNVANVARTLKETLTLSNELKPYSFFRHKVDIAKGDNTPYYYRAFSRRGNPQGEFLGPHATSGPWGSSSEFDGVFYNSSDYSASLRFIKNAKSYLVTLEPHSFSLLSSDTTIANSIRPASSTLQQNSCVYDAVPTLDFIFQSKTTRIPLTSQGLGKIYTDDKGIKTIVPATYTYEIFDKDKNNLDVGIQGLSIGTYDQPGIDFQQSKTAILSGIDYNYPLINNVRDINPITCYAWCQSAEQLLQEQKDSPNEPSLIPYTLPAQLWIVYTTKDLPLMSKVKKIGGITTFQVIRPQVSEKVAHLFIVAVTTSDDNKAQAFLKRLSQGIIGKEAFFTDVQNPLNVSPDVLRKLQPNTNGLITDTQGKDASGVQGFILLNDYFCPTGLSNGPYYYSVPAPLIKIDASFASPLIAALNPSLFSSQTPQEAMLKEIQNLMGDWLKKFNKQTKRYGITTKNYLHTPVPQQIELIIPELTSYLKSKGSPELFSNPTATAHSRIFNEKGKQTLATFLFGPLSLSNPPLLLQAGTNHYVFGGRPNNWPSQKSSPSPTEN
jgi:hypothetical protein